MIISYIVFTCLCIACMIAFLCVRIKKTSSLSLVLKTVASLMFVCIAVTSLLKHSSGITSAMFILGLMFGLFGDMLLDLKVMEDSKTFFNFGTLSFAVGHVLYFLGILTYLKGKIVTGFWWVVLFSLLLSLLCGFMLVKFSGSLKLDLAGYKGQCGGYSSLLIFMTLVSVCLALVIPYVWVLAVGFILFLASDMVLSMQYFGGKQDSKVLTIVNHTLYYLAQILIASFVVFM